MTTVEAETEPQRHLRLVEQEALAEQQTPDWETMSYAEKLARTTSEAATTHVRINGEIHPVEHLLERFGFTYESWRQATELKKAASTYCTFAGVSIGLEKFEASHPHIQLGQE